MMKRATQLAHEVVAERLKSGESAVDATAGNGHDTLFLARLVGETGKVHAFDVQEKAIESSRARIAEAGFAARTSFHCESHALMAERVPAGVGAVMFNLGYLPGADHAVITETDETLRALNVARSLLKPDGVLTVVCYPGHEGGDEEAAAVRDWCLTHRGEVYPAARDGAPFLVVVRGTEGR